MTPGGNTGAGEPRWSPDGVYWWDGTAWRQTSPDRRFYWDGTAWRPLNWEFPRGTVDRSRSRRRWLTVTLAGLGLVALGIGAWAAFTSLPRLQDAVAYVSAARCDASSRRFDNCYIAKDGTIVSIGDRVVYNVADPSSDVCGDGIQFADGSKETFDLTCDAPDFQAGKHVIGRFWKGQLIQVTGDDGTVSTKADQWAVIFGSALGLALILLGVGSIALAWIVRPRARPSSRSA